ncbi:diguanylate cyclase domain-containing protein [Noviherbaspirillum denitrificans]|uniref:Diguanylate cyclase n=1 Tax=Noviherbaspirillum denitrificans TaxID=1968433 RepID=A0A254TE20_9BURK|nr:diguanylate cyclase [Noviherbaspirillum denitrificans]OWW19562.1 hypothetical protein AYR66_08575 [Noviherbaspirillum denitrificans]
MEISSRIKALSLKTKLALYGTTVILLVVFSITTLALWAVRTDVQQNIAINQAALVDSVKDELDEKVTDRKRLITLAAGVFTASDLSSEQSVHEFVKARPTFQYHFDAIFVADKTGRIIYDVPELPGRRGNSVANRPYFKSVMQTGQAVVSEPLLGKTTKEPNIVFAAPIRSASGETVAMLGGILFLSRANFLGKLADAKIGQRGYFALVTKGENPTILMHASRDRIMTPVSDRKTSPHLWDALEGKEGTVEFINSRGVQGIYTFRGMESVPWLLFASYPSSEAYASLYERERQILALATVLALISGAMLWWFSRSLLAPLDKLTSTMRLQLRHPEYRTEPIHVQSEELSLLVSVYDELMDHKRQAEEVLRKSEKKFRGIIDRAGDAFVSLDVNGRVKEWNKQAEMSFGWTREEALGHALTALIMPAELSEKFVAGFSKTARTGIQSGKHQVELTAIARSGQKVPLEILVTTEQGEDGFVAHAFLRDISQRKAAEERIAYSERRLRTVTDNLPMLIGYIDKTQTVKFVNGMSERWLGIPPNEAINHHLSEVVGGHTYAILQPYLERALGGERVKFEFETTVRGISGFNQAVYVPDQEENGLIAGVYALTTDITSLKAVEQELLRLARFDSLTALPNRIQLREKLTEAISRSKRTRAAMAVMYLDIDHFKSINDTKGHAVGDQVLQQFARRLKQSVRETDFVARIAGDEFVIVLENLNFAEEAQLVAKKILLCASEAMAIDGSEMFVTTSIGIAFNQSEESDAAALLARADKALYVAKDAGRNAFYLECGHHILDDTPLSKVIPL